MPPDERQRRIDQMFRQYGRGVGSYVLARVGRVDIAETITSNVFLIVVRRIEQCRESPAAWLWSIVRSELARHFRQRRPADTLEESHPDPGLSPAEAAARNEMQANIRRALALLSEDQQRIIYLKFFLDMPNTEIAAELGLSPSNVGVIVHRAVNRLREIMQDVRKPETNSPKQAGEQRASPAAHGVSRRSSFLLLLAGLAIASGLWLLACGIDIRNIERPLP